MLVLLLPGLVQAGDGSGDGSGGGQLQPLVVESAVPADGSTGVSLNPEIKITFNKNVCYMTVREKNRNGFSMWTGNTRVPIEVIMVDDQVDREKRNDAIIKPLQKLEAATLYRIEISPDVESKSGVTLGQKATISFTTAASQPSSGNSPVSPENLAAPSAETVSGAQPAAAPTPSQTSSGAEVKDAAVQQQSVEQAAPADIAAQQDYRYKRIFIDLTIVALAGLAAWWAYRKWRGQ